MVVSRGRRQICEFRPSRKSPCSIGRQMAIRRRGLSTSTRSNQLEGMMKEGTGSKPRKAVARRPDPKRDARRGGPTD